MPQPLPEVLDYRDLMGKLAHIDREWESLKGLLTFKSPYKNEAPTKNPAVNDNSQMNMDNKVVGFPKPSAPVKTRTGGAAIPSTMPVTTRELEALIQKNVQDSHDGTLMARLIKVERKIHKLTLLVIALMTLTIALFGVLTFLGVKENLVARSAFRQPNEIAAPSNTSSPEAQVSANDYQSPSATAMVSPRDTQSANAADMPAGNVGKSSETETSPAAAKPAPTNEIAAPSNTSSPEAQVSANDHQSPSATAMVSPKDTQSANAADMPAGNVGKSSETETSPAAAEPAPKFVGSITSNKIHYPDCKWAAKIKPDRLITFPSIAAARAQGYIPCPVCRPHESDETH
jgi:hypothetical protein